MSVRASRRSMLRKESLKPRTPVSEPTPAATARMTNRNLARAERASRRAILSAVDQGNRSGMLLAASLRAGGDGELQLIAPDRAVAQRDPPVGGAGQLAVVRHQQQRRAFPLIQLQQQIEDQPAVGRVQVAGGLIG